MADWSPSHFEKNSKERGAEEMSFQATIESTFRKKKNELRRLPARAQQLHKRNSNFLVRLAASFIHLVS